MRRREHAQSPLARLTASSSQFLNKRGCVKRTSPLMHHEHGDSIAVVASKAGQPTNPSWFRNLMANPDTTIQIGATLREVRVRVATDEERARLWPEFVASYPGYEFYERNAKAAGFRS